MADGGLSESRLERMNAAMAGYVERGELPGLVTAVSRRGEVHIDAHGVQSMDGTVPMRSDSIFRIASLTKPVTAVAALILAEECRLRLDDPVDRWLPELANRQVLRRMDGPLDETVPANRPITVRDLLTFRLGWGIVFGSPEQYPFLQAVQDLEVVGFGPPNPDTPHDPDEWLRRLSTLPLLHQPGERWMYNTGSYVLGVLIARAAGQPLGTFLRERIFEPLGMRDTGFSVPPDKLNRLVDAYQPNAGADDSDMLKSARSSQWGRPPVFPDGGGGLVSTVDDFLAFGQLLVNQGRHGNQRILARPTVEAMTTNQLTAEQQVSAGIILGENSGWGFGVSMVLRRDDIASVPGRYGWTGGYGTSWSSDPAEGMVIVLLTQRMFAGPDDLNMHRDFWTLAYQAIDD